MEKFSKQNSLDLVDLKKVGLMDQEIIMKVRGGGGRTRTHGHRALGSSFPGRDAIFSMNDLTASTSTLSMANCCSIPLYMPLSEKAKKNCCSG